jgi:hypothetical protein
MHRVYKADVKVRNIRVGKDKLSSQGLKIANYVDYGHSFAIIEHKLGQITTGTWHSGSALASHWVIA